MAQQSLVSISAQQDELCNWEFIDQSDFELQSDGDDSIYEVQSIDFADSLSSSSDDDAGEQSLATIDLDSPHVDEADDDDVTGQPPIHTPDEVNRATVLDIGHDCCDNLSSFSADLSYDDGNRHPRYDNDDDVIESPPIHPFDKVNFTRVLDCGVIHENFSNYSADLGYDDGNRRLLHYGDVCGDDDEGDSDDDGAYGLNDELVPWGVIDKFERQRIRKLGKRTFAKMTKSKRSALIYTRPGCVRGKHGLGLKAF